MRFFLIFSLVILVSCSHQDTKTVLPHQKAIAVIQALNNSKLSGVVIFSQKGKLVEINVQISGLKPNQKHGFHVHQYGDISDPKGLSAGGHYNPKGFPHALPPAKARHAGSFGNLKADKNGKAKLTFLDDSISVSGDYHPIIGRSIVIHRDEDKGTQPSGGAGPRIGIGVIGIAK